MDDDLRRIRDLISAAPLQRIYMSDRSRWRALCDGLDGIGDHLDLVRREKALDVVRDLVGLEPLVRADDGSEATLVAGIAAVRAELEDQLNDIRRRFVHAPLSPLIDSSGYLVEKTQALAAGSATAFDRAAAQDLLSRLRDIKVGLEQRHVDYEEHLHDVESAIFTVDAVLAESGRPEVRLLAEYGLPVMLGEIADLLRDVDALFDENAGGWPR